MKREVIAAERASIVGEYLNLEKDFFSMSPEEMRVLRFFKKAFNYSGRNNMGRSELRQFYYHLQEGHKKNIEGIIINPYA